MAVSGVVVKRLSAGDEPEVRRFDEAFDQPVDGELTARFLADDRHHLVVAYADGEPAGFVSATEIFHPDKPTELFLNELAVLPAHRRKGAATSLLEELKHLAKEHGCVSIWVLTDEDNEAAVASYRKAGGVWDGATTVMFEIDLTR
jgi:[ribosomal protein S18]-alanine N-acetyltransferase